MAYGQFTGYEPDPTVPGAYSFQTAGGQPLLFAGPEAEQLKARIDASNAANMVAGPGGGSDWERFRAANAAAAEKANQDAAAGVVPTAQQAQAQAAAEPQGGGVEPVRIGSGNVAGLRRRDGVLEEYQGGSAGVTKQQLEQRDADAVAQRTSAQETIAGGFEPSQEYLEKREELAGKQRKVDERNLQQEIASNDEIVQLERQRFEQQARDLKEQEDRAKEINQRVADAEKKRDAALAAKNSAKEDPNRIFAGEDGGIRQVIAAISAAMGAYAATIGGTKNFAQDMIDRAIDRDIEAQRAEIRIKGEAADNAIAEFEREGMDRDQAELTVRMMRNEYAQNAIKQSQSASNDQRIIARYDDLFLNREQQNNELKEQYRQDAIGKATRTVASQFASPRAGSAGGWRPVSVDRALRLEERGAELDSKNASTAKTLEEAKQGGSAAQTRGVESEKINRITALADGIDAALQIRSELTGAGESEFDDPAAGPLDRLDFGRTNRIKEQTQRLAKGAQASRGKSDKDAELAEIDVSGNGSEAARTRLAEQQLRIQRDALIQELQGMTPQQREQVIKGLPESAKRELRGE